MSKREHCKAKTDIDIFLQMVLQLRTLSTCEKKWSSDDRFVFAQIYFNKVQNWLLHKHD